MRVAARAGVDSAQEGKGDDGVTAISGLGDEVFFEIVRGMHLAGGDLVFCGSDEAEFTTGEAFAVRNTDRRAEDAAGHGTKSVDIAEAALGIKGGAGCVIGELFKAGLVLFGCAEDASGGIAGEVGGVLLQPGVGAVADGFGQVRIEVTEGLHARLEARGV